MKSVSFIVVIGVMGLSTAWAENKVKCSGRCSMKLPNGQTINKEIQCEYSTPPGISFTGADCVKQCVEKCANSFGINAPGAPRKPKLR